jgi:uroporphyrinogen decarboxylase
LDGRDRLSSGQTVPVILFTKGAGPLLADMAETGCDALGVDWTTDLATARELTADKVALQGNLNPNSLRKSPDAISKAVANVLQSYGNGPGHVFNLGHGITPDIDPDHVKVLVETVRALSPQYHQR